MNRKYFYSLIVFFCCSFIRVKESLELHFVASRMANCFWQSRLGTCLYTSKLNPVQFTFWSTQSWEISGRAGCNCDGIEVKVCKRRSLANKELDWTSSAAGKESCG